MRSRWIFFSFSFFFFFSSFLLATQRKLRQLHEGQEPVMQYAGFPLANAAPSEKSLDRCTSQPGLELARGPILIQIDCLTGPVMHCLHEGCDWRLPSPGLIA